MLLLLLAVIMAATHRAHSMVRWLAFCSQVPATAEFLTRLSEVRDHNHSCRIHIQETEEEMYKVLHQGESWKCERDFVCKGMCVSMYMETRS